MLQFSRVNECTVEVKGFGHIVQSSRDEWFFWPNCSKSFSVHEMMDIVNYMNGEDHSKNADQQELFTEAAREAAAKGEGQEVDTFEALRAVFGEPVDCGVFGMVFNAGAAPTKPNSPKDKSNWNPGNYLLGSDEE